MKFGLQQKTLEAIINVFRQNPKVEKCILYGSRAKGNYQTGSDIDLTLLGTELKLTDLFQIENALDEQLLPYKIDLSIYHQIKNPDLIGHIQRVGQEIYSKTT